MSDTARLLVPVDQAEHEALKARVAKLEAWINLFMDHASTWTADAAIRSMIKMRRAERDEYDRQVNAALYYRGDDT